MDGLCPVEGLCAVDGRWMDFPFEFEDEEPSSLLLMETLLFLADFGRIGVELNLRRIFLYSACDL